MKRKLTDSIAKFAKPKADGKSNHLTDGGRLFLLVNQASKYWRYNYRFSGKSKTLAIGTYPEISLKDARRRHEEASLTMKGTSSGLNWKAPGKAGRRQHDHNPSHPQTPRSQNRGSCPYCAMGRMHKHKQREPLPDDHTTRAGPAPAFSCLAGKTLK